MYCQACGAHNQDEREYCGRCQHKLLVLSGGVGQDDDDEEEFSFDEHLLERISILEEAVKRTAELMRQVLDALRRQEKNTLVNQTGFEALREMLEHERVVARDELVELWNSKLEGEMQALERRDRFLAVRERVVALFAGERRQAFLSLVEEADHSFAALDTERALDALEHAHRLDRGNVELAHFLGETHFNEGAPERALPYFLRLLEAAPDHADGLVYSGVILHAQGEAPRAEEHLKRAVAVAPDSFLAHFSLGAIYADRSNLAAAERYLEAAVSIEPVPHALYLLGSVLYEAGRPTAAIARLKQAVRRDPDFEEAHHLLGLAYLDRGWHKKALESFRRAERINPRKLRYSDVVSFLSGAGGPPLPEVAGEAAAWATRAEEKLGAGDHPGALTAYRRALEIDPDNPTLLMSYALLCLELDRVGEIETVSKKVLAAHPGEMLETTASAALIEALRSQGRFREGNRIGEDLLGEARSAFTRSIAYYEMACNLAEMEEDLDRALDYARRSLDDAPEELKQFPLAALGWIHYKREELDEAIDFLARASEIGASATTFTHLGMALLAAGRESEARDVLARAREVGERRQDLGSKMMDFMKDSMDLYSRVRRATDQP